VIGVINAFSDFPQQKINVFLYSFSFSFDFQTILFIDDLSLGSLVLCRFLPAFHISFTNFVITRGQNKAGSCWFS
jgi:hypothetical protein